MPDNEQDVVRVDDAIDGSVDDTQMMEVENLDDAAAALAAPPPPTTPAVGFFEDRESSTRRPTPASNTKK